MSNKKLTVLGLVAAAMIVLAVVQNRASKSAGPVSKGQSYLIQGLNPSQIGSIVLGAGDDTVTLERRQGRFVVAEKGGYPAAMDKINELVASCLDIKTTDMYTDDEKNHADLGVTEDKAKNVVKFLKGDSSLLTGVIIGKNKESGSGAFVRLVSDNKVYLSLDVPWLRTGAMDYIDTSFTSINAGDIESVQVGSDKESYTIKRKAGSDELVLENIPKGKKKKDDDCKRVFEALTGLRFSDVSKGTTGVLFNRKYICRLKDSTVYTLSIGLKDSKNYLVCSAEFTDQTPVTRPEASESEEELKKKEALLVGRDKAAQFSQRHNGWVYEIEQYNADNLVKASSDLMEDLPKPKEAEQITEPNE